MLPPVVRIVVSKPMFKVIAQDLFDRAIGFAKAHVSATAHVVPADVVKPGAV